MSESYGLGGRRTEKQQTGPAHSGRDENGPFLAKSPRAALSAVQIARYLCIFLT
jgi:hypothetical protein